jgi:hypothetical protein
LNELLARLDALVQKIGPLADELGKLVLLTRRAEELTDGEVATFQIDNGRPTMIAPARPRRRGFIAQVEGGTTDIRIGPNATITTAKGVLIEPGDRFTDEFHTGPWYAIAVAAGPAQVNVIDILKVDSDALL